jgi:pimeloyl-ACP methyl ester carboxylesterase
MEVIMKRRSLVSFVGLVVFLGMGAQTILSQQKLFDVGRHEIYINCSGQRHGPAVIFEAGNGRSSEDWSKVQPEVAKFTLACSYDRVGLGKSSSTAGEPERRVDDKIQDLHALLAKAEIPPPYILVGHSLGGLFVRRFTTIYPKEVVGMVLVDSVHEEGVWHALDIDPENAIRGSERLPDLVRNEGYLPARERLVWHYDIPLIVLRHGKVIDFGGPAQQHSAEIEAMMREEQRDLASRSRYGEVRTAEQSGHFIQLDQPEMVVQAVRDVWDKVSRVK